MSVTSLTKTSSSRASTYLTRAILTLVGLGSVAGTASYLDLRNKLTESERGRLVLVEDLQKTNATIARLEQRVLNNSSQIDKLQEEVSISELQDVVSRALDSSVMIRFMLNEGGEPKGNLGSGVIAAHIGDGTKGGYIVTNWHVLQLEELKDEDYKGREVVLILKDGTKVKGEPYYFKDVDGKEKLARNKKNDLVLIKTTEDISKSKPASFSLEEPSIGEGVVVIGNSFGGTVGDKFSASFGIVSGDSYVKFGGLDPEILKTHQEDAILATRSDVAVSHGSSGGNGMRIKDSKFIFMPSFIFPNTFFHGSSFGVTSPTVIKNVESWIPYQLNSDGVFVEKTQ